MPAFDHCHSQIVRALEKDGWAVQPRSPRLIVKERLVIIDIQAARVEDASSVLLVEVKCFPDQKSTSDLYIAFGQYILYRALLAELELGIPLYLAVPEDVYQKVFDDVVLRAVKDNAVSLIIVDLEQEMISQWQPQPFQ
jgi:hypothetical protein